MFVRPTAHIGGKKNFGFLTDAGLLAETVEGTTFSYQILTFGEGFTASVSSGSLPPGITLNGGTMTLSGTPGGVSGVQTYNFTIRLTKTGFVQRSFSIRVSNSTVFLAITASTMIRSVDLGTTWTQVSVPISGLIGVAAGREGRVVAANNTQIAYSGDYGLTWTAGPTFTNIARVSYAGDYFFISLGGGFSKSTDGVNWSAVSTAGGLASCTNFAYLNGTYVTANASNDNVFRKSTDTVTWTNTNLDLSVATRYVVVCAGVGVWFFCGDNMSNNSASAKFSSNLTSFSNHQIAGQGNNITKFAASPTHMAFAGSNNMARYYPYDPGTFYVGQSTLSGTTSGVVGTGIAYGENTFIWVGTSGFMYKGAGNAPGGTWTRIQNTAHGLGTNNFVDITCTIF